MTCRATRCEIQLRDSAKTARRGAARRGATESYSKLASSIVSSGSHCEAAETADFDAFARRSAFLSQLFFVFVKVPILTLHSSALTSLLLLLLLLLLLRPLLPLLPPPAWNSRTDIDSSASFVIVSKMSTWAPTRVLRCRRSLTALSFARFGNGTSNGRRAKLNTNLSADSVRRAVASASMKS